MLDPPFTKERPFAEYLRAIGKGPKMFRDLEEVEAQAAMEAILAGEVDPLQLGAFLMLMRRKGETAGELAGFVRAVRRRWTSAGHAVRPDLDWPSYADRHKQQPWFVLSALLLAANGVKVLMHGIDGEETGFATTRGALAAFGIHPVSTLEAAARELDRANLAYLAVDDLCPELDRLFRLRPLLGVRTAVNTCARALNPMDAPAQMLGVFHTAYRALHREIALKLGQPRTAIFKGIGGEAQRSPFKECVVHAVQDGTAVDEIWPQVTEPALPPYRWRDERPDVGYLTGLWRGEHDARIPREAVISTAALALSISGRASSQEDALEAAKEMWKQRPAGVTAK